MENTHNMQRSVLQVCKVGLELKNGMGASGQGAAPPPKAEWQYLFSQAML